MLDNSMDALLTMLNETTYKSNNLNTTLTEATGDDIGDSISKRILSLSNKLLQRMKSSGPAYLSQETQDLIYKVRKVHITQSHRVMSYPNIHNDRKYDVKAQVVMDYVLKKVDESLNDDKIDFDPNRINREAIAYAFKILTNKSYGQEMTIDEFNMEYRTYALGGVQKVLIFPKIHILTALASRSPYIINYIEDKLMYRHMRSLKRYASEVEDHFNKLIAGRPELRTQLNKYIDCIELAINNIMRMYKTIRLVFTELDVEYRNVFREILSIDRELNGNVNYESITEFINANVHNLRETCSIMSTNTITESIDENTIKESLILSKESLNNTLDRFKESCIKLDNERKKSFEFICNNMGLVSTLNDIDINGDIKILTLSNINTNIVPWKLKNIIIQDSYPENADRYDIINTILKDTGFNNCIADRNSTNFIGDTIYNISNKMIGGNQTHITPNIEILANNLIEIYDLLKLYDKHITNICSRVQTNLEYLVTKFNNNEISKIDFKGIFDKIIKFDFIWLTILNCVYKNLSVIGEYSIGSILKLKKYL